MFNEELENLYKDFRRYGEILEIKEIESDFNGFTSFIKIKKDEEIKEFVLFNGFVIACKDIKM